MGLRCQSSTQVAYPAGYPPSSKGFTNVPISIYLHFNCTLIKLRPPFSLGLNCWAILICSCWPLHMNLLACACMFLQVSFETGRVLARKPRRGKAWTFTNSTLCWTVSFNFINHAPGIYFNSLADLYLEVWTQDLHLVLGLELTRRPSY